MSPNESSYQPQAGDGQPGERPRKRRAPAESTPTSPKMRELRERYEAKHTEQVLPPEAEPSRRRKS